MDPLHMALEGGDESPAGAKAKRGGGWVPWGTWALVPTFPPPVLIPCFLI